MNEQPKKVDQTPVVTDAPQTPADVAAPAAHTDTWPKIVPTPRDILRANGTDTVLAAQATTTEATLVMKPKDIAESEAGVSWRGVLAAVRDIRRNRH